MTEQPTDGDNSGPRADPHDGELPVVAIGASAGGLDQLHVLFAHMPTDTGAAFVVLQHLAPQQKSQLAALLARKTDLAVVAIEHRMALEANRIHVIPAGYRLSLEGDRLLLEEDVRHAAMTSVIDGFFRDLADVKDGAAVGIVLSGTGRDGARGLKQIKTRGGLAMAQDPASAEYDGMPRAAIDAVPLDYVLETAELVAPLVNHLRRNVYREDAPDEIGDPRLEAILKTLRRHNKRHNFVNYKPSMLKRRIQRRFALAGFDNAREYARRLHDSETERDRLAQDFRISVTDFFRDPQTYETLKAQALAPLLADRASDRLLRIWVPGCATGEEAYSIAIAVAEAIDEAEDNYQFVIFASDVDDHALAFARQGVYPDSIAADISEARLNAFFDKTDHQYRVKASLRERIVFAQQNIIDDPPYSGLDLISCRNLIMYLKAEVQTRILGTFHFALNDRGFLFLGSSETIGDRIDLFEAVAKEQRLFRRIGENQRRGRDLSFVPQAKAGRPSEPDVRSHSATRSDHVERIARDILLREHVPAAVVVNRKLEIVCSYGPSRDYFALPHGQSSLELMDMVHQEYRSPLRAAIHRAQREDERSEVESALSGDDSHSLRIVARPLRYPEAVRTLMMVTLERLPRAGQAVYDRPVENEVEQQLASELEATRRELHSTIQALEASNEDLKSSNEEILSMNEELQSSNEELETSKEELQSLNEELTTVNSELESKVDELENTHNDLYNLFSGTQLATLFLDRERRIKRFTPTVRELLRVIDSDVGRPLADITFKFEDPDLLADADAVLGDLAAREREVSAQDGRWYLRRILPYRTRADRIEGVVITFTNITELKRATLATRESENRLDVAMTTLDGGIWDMPLTPEGDEPDDEIYISPQLKRLLGFEDAQIANSLDGWRERVIAEDRSAFKNPAQLGADHADVEYRIRHRDGSIRWFSSHGRIVADDRGQPTRWIGIDYDITERKQAEAQNQQMRAQLQLLADAVPQMIAYIDRDGVFRFTNAAYNAGFDVAPEDVIGHRVDHVLGAQAQAILAPHVASVNANRMVNCELEARLGTGQPHLLRFNLLPHTVDGEVLGHYALIVDVTEHGERRTMQPERQSGLIYLQRMATLGEMTSTLAHDLKQPLSAINTYAGALTRMLNSDKPAAETTPVVQKIADQVRHANNIVDTTRDFVGRHDIDHTALDVNSLIQRALALTEGVARELNVDRQLELRTPLPAISCFPVQIEQVLINLMNNAYDAMQDIDRDARILRVATERTGHDEIQISLADSGEGIPIDRLDRIFDVFYTSKLDGMGLGLPLARAIVEDHGGRIWVESEASQGTTFFICLPIVAPDQPA